MHKALTQCNKALARLTAEHTFPTPQGWKQLKLINNIDVQIIVFTVAFTFRTHKNIETDKFYRCIFTSVISYSYSDFV